MIPKKYYLTIGLFFLSLLLNTLSSQGILFPYTQSQISDRYANVLAPDYFTFSIWGVIYLLFALSLLFPFVKKWRQGLGSLQLRLTSYHLVWLLANCAWIVAWSYNQLLLSWVILTLYFITFVKINLLLSQYTETGSVWTMRVIHGLHTGWLLAAWFANAMTLLVKSGMPGYGFWGVLIAAIMAVLLAVLAFHLQDKLHNPIILIAVIWAFIGIASKNAPTSLYKHASLVLYGLTWAIVVILSVALVYQIVKLVRTILAQRTRY